MVWKYTIGGIGQVVMLSVAVVADRPLTKKNDTATLIHGSNSSQFSSALDIQQSSGTFDAEKSMIILLETFDPDTAAANLTEMGPASDGNDTGHGFVPNLAGNLGDKYHETKFVPKKLTSVYEKSAIAFGMAALQRNVVKNYIFMKTSTGYLSYGVFENNQYLSNYNDLKLAENVGKQVAYFEARLNGQAPSKETVKMTNPDLLESGAAVSTIPWSHGSLNDFYYFWHFQFVGIDLEQIRKELAKLDNWNKVAWTLSRTLVLPAQGALTDMQNGTLNLDFHVMLGGPPVTATTIWYRDVPAIFKSDMMEKL